MFNLKNSNQARGRVSSCFFDPDPGGDQIRSLWSVSILIRRKDFYRIKAEFQDEANRKTRDRRKINCETGDRNR